MATRQSLPASLRNSHFFLDIDIRSAFRSHSVSATGMQLGACCALFCFALHTLSAGASSNFDAVEAGDFWDSEDLAAPVVQPEPVVITPKQLQTQAQPEVKPLREESKSVGPEASRSLLQTILGAQGSYYVEVVFVLLSGWFVTGIFTGKNANNKIIKAWTDTHLGEGGVLERNFAQLGSGDGDGTEVVMKESPKKFKFWASGRRHCQVCSRFGIDPMQTTPPSCCAI